MSIAYIKNRYSQRVYSVSASIIIKEAEQTSGAELLYSNDIIDPYRNYFNEIYIIRSYPLIRSVLEDLNFGVAFYREGNFLTSELYDFPVKVSILNKDQVKSCSFIFTILNQEQYELSTPAEKTANRGATFTFNDTITYQGVKAVFLTEGSSLESERNNSLIFRYTSPEYLTGAYVSNLNASWAEEGSGVMD